MERWKVRWKERPGPGNARRRRCLFALALAAWAPLPMPMCALAHGKLGSVTPARPVPGGLTVWYQGRRTLLRELLLGKTSAVQLMFAGCSSICPVQGAMFAAVQAELDAFPDLQLLSLSIDALGDDDAALASWQRRFAAQSRWRAAALEPPGLAVFNEMVGAPTDNPAGHSTAVYFFDADASLAWRTNDLPGAREVAATLRRLHRPGK